MNRRDEPLPPRVRADPVQERPPLPTDSSELPSLPPEFRSTLDPGLVELGLSLDDGQLAALDSYVRLLLAWTAAINLTAIREPAAVAREHLLDSLAAVAILRGRGAMRIVDIGSGGGVPGLPIAIARPEVRVLLVESVAKKATFLDTAVRALDLADRVEVANDRAEDLGAAGREREQWDAVMARAVAGLPVLVELAMPLLRTGGSLIAWKRGAIDDELAAGRRALVGLGGGELSIVPITVTGLQDHVLVVARKSGPTPRRFPRSPQERLRQPW